MTLHVTQLESQAEHRSFRLSRPAAPVSREVRDDLVLPAESARAVLAAAARQDVSRGGAYSPGPAGVQVWSGAWTGQTGGAGTSEHLGSVDWSWDTPVTAYVTVYRVMLTVTGASRGLTTDALLGTVLGLADAQLVQQSTASAAIPLPRDPFRSSSWASPALTGRATKP